MKKKVFRVLGFLACLSFWAQAQTWDPAKRLTHTTGDSSAGAVAAYSSHVHAVWSDDVSGVDELYYKRSTDLGVTWSAPTRLTWGGAMPLSPRIGVNGAFVHIVYVEDTELIYRRSTDSGATWSRTQITWGLKAAYVDMAVNGNTIHLGIIAVPAGPWAALNYKRSTDDGDSWSSPLYLGRANAVLGAFSAGLSASGTNVHVVYSDDSLHVGHLDLRYRRSTNNGADWSAPVQVARLERAPLRSSEDSANFAVAASIASSGANVHILYTGASNLYPAPLSNVYCTTSTNNGATWRTAQQVTYGNTVIFVSSRASAASGSNVYVTYLNRETDDVYFKTSPDAGLTWSAPTRLTYIGSPGAMDANASLVYSPGTGYFHILFGIYIDPVYRDEIYYKRGH